MLIQLAIGNNISMLYIGSNTTFQTDCHSNTGVLKVTTRKQDEETGATRHPTFADLCIYHSAQWLPDDSRWSSLFDFPRCFFLCSSLSSSSPQTPRAARLWMDIPREVQVNIKMSLIAAHLNAGVILVAVSYTHLTLPTKVNV